ncbi:bZIP transcription factor 53-like [Typha angustifolia]|uniref:bZIP transcription factor 53-like n=1 Tax=Typha angustifolia TaxID=59011 RepID=UPI003C2EAEF9
MSSPQSNQSSGSEEDLQLAAVDPRKRKRMLSNRESARRSRIRKKQHLDELVNQVAHLKNEKNRILMQSDMIAGQYRRLESENTILRTQLMELSERLQSVNSVLWFMEESSGKPMGIPQIPDPLLKPWQLPCPAWPVIGSAIM